MKKLTVTTAIMVFFSIVALTAITPIQANAAIATVDIDSMLNTPANPVTVTLDMGSYVLTPVLTPFDYNAWNPWEGQVTTKPPSNRDRGWLNVYWVYYNNVEYQIGDVGDPIIYSTPEEAFAAMYPFSFNLCCDDSEVLFYMKDSEFRDNLGGISLEVSQVPIPGALWLLGTGLIGLVGARKRFKR